MKFTVLNKKLLENESILELIYNVRMYPTIFSREQILKFNINTDDLKFLILSDFNQQTKKYLVHLLLLRTKDVNEQIHEYNTNSLYDVLPIINYNDIKNGSTITSEDEFTYKITYGKYFSSRVDGGPTIEKIKMANLKGNLVESGQKITIALYNDGRKIKLRVYKNVVTNEEFVFMSTDTENKINDNPSENADFIGRVKPVKWTVDKITNLAICDYPLFLAENLVTTYESSELNKFLESEEFMQELGVTKVEKEEKTYSSPFGDKKEKLSLEDKIKRILMSEKRIPYLVGHPGIGKTQIAKSINKNCLAYNLATFTPDTFSGKTSIIPGDKIITKDNDRVIEHNERGRTATAEPEWHSKLVAMSNKCYETNERCVLLLDEFDKLTPNMQVFINGIVDSPRTIAGWEIPANVDLILAGNTEEYSDAAFNISGEVASRLTKLEVTADTIDWLRWANKHDIDPIVKAYLYNCPEKIIQDVKNKDGEYDYALSLTPRSWDQKISEELKASRKIGEYPYLEPYMNDSTRKEFEEFITLYFQLGIEEILKGNIPEDILLHNLSRVQTIIMCLIATVSTEEEIENALKFIELSHQKEYQAVFKNIWLKINSSDEDILKFRLAESTINERTTSHGK